MLNEKSSYCSNKFEELEHLENETIKGVLQYDKKTYILFESGYAFWFNSSGAFAIEDKYEVEDILNKQKGKHPSQEDWKQDTQIICSKIKEGESE